MLFLLQPVPLRAGCDASLLYVFSRSRHVGVDKTATIRYVSFGLIWQPEASAEGCERDCVQEARLSSACKSLVDLVGPCTGLGLSLLEAGVGACSCHTS